MEKRLSLEQAWSVSLRMWKWIAEQRKKERMDSVTALKDEWFETQQKKYEADDFLASCPFCEYSAHPFCEYSAQTNVDANMDDDDFCGGCPGKLVDKRFKCRNRTYNYYREPVKFYKKLLQLDAKRRLKMSDGKK